MVCEVISRSLNSTRKSSPNLVAEFSNFSCRIQALACYSRPMRHLIALLLATAAGPVFAANYATCILDKMPGVANDVVAQSVLQVCRQKHPGGFDAVKNGSGRGFFGYKSGAECTIKKAEDTRSMQGAAMIRASCIRLYDEVRYLTDEEIGLPAKR